MGPNCYDGIDGPFDFTVAVRAGGAPVKTTVEMPERVTAAGAVTVGVRGPHGQAIDDSKLVLKLYANGRAVATASPRAGVARFTVELPSGGVRLQVVGTGAGYAPVKSEVADRTVP